MDPTDLRIVTRRPSLSVHVEAGTMRLRASNSDEELVAQIASHDMLRNVDSDDSEHKHRHVVVIPLAAGAPLAVYAPRCRPNLRRMEHARPSPAQ